MFEVVRLTQQHNGTIDLRFKFPLSVRMTGTRFAPNHALKTEAEIIDIEEETVAYQIAVLNSMQYNFK